MPIKSITDKNKKLTRTTPTFARLSRIVVACTTECFDFVVCTLYLHLVHHCYGILLISLQQFSKIQSSSSLSTSCLSKLPISVISSKRPAEQMPSLSRSASVKVKQSSRSDALVYCTPWLSPTPKRQIS